MFCWSYVGHCGGMWIFLVDVMWNIVEEWRSLWSNVGVLWSNMDVMWMLCGTLRRNVDVLWRELDVPPHLQISQFDQVLSPPWSVILRYVIVGVMWTLCRTLWRNVDVLWRNGGVIWTLRISTFHNLTSKIWYWNLFFRKIFLAPPPPPSFPYKITLPLDLSIGHYVLDSLIKLMKGYLVIFQP